MAMGVIRQANSRPVGETVHIYLRSAVSQAGLRVRLWGARLYTDWSYLLTKLRRQHISRAAVTTALLTDGLRKQVLFAEPRPSEDWGT